ncbi:hypothetical protein F2981_21335 (plasmid) [Sinorhizobium meliloti]|nr:hypothetical protein [Sinorhizobium meliloti]
MAIVYDGFQRLVDIDGRNIDSPIGTPTCKLAVESDSGMYSCWRPYPRGEQCRSPGGRQT